MFRAVLMAVMLVGAVAPLAGAQASCVNVSSWATDAAGDASIMVDGQAVPGSVDIRSIRVGESGDDCEQLVLGVQISDSDVKQLLEDAAETALIPGTGQLVARVDVDPSEVAEAYEDHSFEFYFALDVDLVSLIPVETAVSYENAWVVHRIDGDMVATTQGGPAASLSHVHSNGVLDAVVAKEALDSIHGWEGVQATTDPDDTLGGILSALELTGGTDQASSSVAYTFGKGLGDNIADLDADGLLDSWETTHFGNRSAANGTGDADGDGYTNAQEQALGSDPNDADSPADPEPVPPTTQDPPTLGDDPASNTGGGSDDAASGGSGTEDEGSKEAPSPGMMAAAVALLGLAVAVRRRH